MSTSFLIASSADTMIFSQNVLPTSHTSLTFESTSIHLHLPFGCSVPTWKDTGFFFSLLWAFSHENKIAVIFIQVSGGWATPLLKPSWIITLREELSFLCSHSTWCYHSHSIFKFPLKLLLSRFSVSDDNLEISLMIPYYPFKISQLSLVNKLSSKSCDLPKFTRTYVARLAVNILMQDPKYYVLVTQTQRPRPVTLPLPMR